MNSSGLFWLWKFWLGMRWIIVAKLFFTMFLHGIHEICRNVHRSCQIGIVTFHVFALLLQQWLTKYPKKAAVLRIAEQGGSFQQIRTIMLLRVSPFPYPIFNYAVTATNIQYSEYIVGSILGMVPEAFITIYRWFYFWLTCTSVVDVPRLGPGGEVYPFAI